MHREEGQETGGSKEMERENRSLPRYAPITTNNNTKSRLRTKLNEFRTKARYGAIEL